jgi:hypothetical protein
MKITYAVGGEHPNIAAILTDIAINNPDATATVQIGQFAGRPVLNERVVTFRAPELDLMGALFEGRHTLKIKGLSSKRSGKNTSVTITYQLL